MITLPAGARILLATRPVDFRKGAHSLAALAAEMMGEDPFSGVVLLFRSKRGSCPVWWCRSAGSWRVEPPCQVGTAESLTWPVSLTAATVSRVI